ncbi:hypothetical protein [Rufibacter roseus]|nr:hypothetical protein [Rufibacter roseus]
MQNLWPSDLGSSKLNLPKNILIQQGKFLEEMTKNVITVEIKSTQSASNDIIHRVNILAPALGNYSFGLLTMSHKISLYPLTIIDEVNLEKHFVEDEPDLLNSLASIFNSQPVKNALNSLIAQSS